MRITLKIAIAYIFLGGGVLCAIFPETAVAKTAQISEVTETSLSLLEEEECVSQCQFYETSPEIRIWLRSISRCVVDPEPIPEACEGDPTLPLVLFLRGIFPPSLGPASQTPSQKQLQDFARTILSSGKDLSLPPIQKNLVDNFSLVALHSRVTEISIPTLHQILKNVSVSTKLPPGVLSLPEIPPKS